MITVSKEDYLKAIAAAEAEGENVVPATLANWFNVSRPAIAAAMKRLRDDGFVRTANDGRIGLTVRGRRIAARVMFRHRLIERMLTEIFEMPWHEVAGEAERLEHVISASFEKRLVSKLGKSGTCPHGNAPTALTARERRRRGLLPLSEAEIGSKCLVTIVYERDHKLLQFFAQQGLKPGKAITVQDKHYDGTTSILIDGKPFRLGLSAAQRIWVKKRNTGARP